MLLVTLEKEKKKLEPVLWRDPLPAVSGCE